MFAEYEALLPKIASINDFRVRRDLLHIARSCENIKQAISIELITCRRQKKHTVKYFELLENFCRVLETLGEYTTLALLMDH